LRQSYLGVNNEPSEAISPNDHVPAIAPSMKLRARSETLSDIGSAFSIPLSGSHGQPMSGNYTPPPYFALPLASPPAAVIKFGRSSRLRTWFTWSSSGHTSTPTESPTYHLAESPTEPFYQCVPVTAELYRSPSISTFSSLSSTSDVSPNDFTAVTTPISFTPNLEHHSPKSEVSSRPRASTSTRRMGSRHVPLMPKRRRGESADTTYTMSSVATSILGSTTASQTAVVGKEAYAAHNEMNPLRGNPVGMAF